MYEQQCISSETQEDQDLDPLEKLYREIRGYYKTAKLYYKRHATAGNIEYLVAPDLAAGKPMASTPEKHARQFLLDNAALYGFANRKQFQSRLFLKHTLDSQMGTHYIYGMRVQEDIDEHCFVVHLDRQNRIVMVTSVYTPDLEIPQQEDQASVELPPDLRAALELIMYHRQRHGVGLRIDRQWYVLWKNKRARLELLWQVKLLLPYNEQVILCRDDGTKVRTYSLTKRAGPENLTLGRVYRDFWPTEQHPKAEQTQNALLRQLKPVILHDLDSQYELQGRYVTVEDEIYPVHSKLLSSESLDIDPGSALTSSWLDRMMAYHYVDHIQRYFRDLGLSVLDTYSHFLPMRVVLDNSKTGTKYLPNKKNIRLSIIPLKDSTGTHVLGEQRSAAICTDARDRRIIYHEFVHTVTDALARLKRGDRNYKSSRRREIYQAAAMDEGLADYFACSLAVRQGARNAYIYPGFELTDSAIQVQIKAKRPRCLGTQEGKARAYSLRRAYNPKAKLTLNSTEYVWGEQWGRYLWRLRSSFGYEVADRLIAHSIFFLTRWSSFGLGVLALAVADRLLFGGIHESEILEWGQGAQDWEIKQDKGDE